MPHEITDAMRRCMERKPTLKKPEIVRCTCGRRAGPTGLCTKCFFSRDTTKGSILRPTNDNHDHRQTPRSESKCALRDEPLEARKAEEGDSVLVSIRVCSHRRRLIDPDNLVAKFHVDCLRYAKFITDDSAAHVSFSISQVKVKTKEEERTEITLEFPERGPRLDVQVV